MCASLQYTLVQIILAKIEKIVREKELTQVVIGGGVAANSEIRNQLLSKEQSEGWEVYLPPLEYTTDNAAMIGITAFYKIQQQSFGTLFDRSDARLKFS